MDTSLGHEFLDVDLCMVFGGILKYCGYVFSLGVDV